MLSRLFVGCFVLLQTQTTFVANWRTHTNLEKNDEKLKSAATFHFPEYAYKETSKNELLFHELELSCEQQTRCEELQKNIQKKACVRRCISAAAPNCYQDIYGFDELEEGEIDVRLNSFKGCVIGSLNRR